MNGGMQRCFHLVHQLAKRFKVSIVIHQERRIFLEAVTEYPAIANVQVVSTKDHLPGWDIFNLLPKNLRKAFRYRWYKKELRGPADGNFLTYYPALKKLLQNQRFDYVILENLATINAVSVIRQLAGKVMIFYDAHNVDSNLAFLSQPLKHGKKVRGTNLEKILHKTVDSIITCSKNDLDELVKLNGNKLKGTVVPNGVKVSETLFNEGGTVDNPKYILFCGSLAYPPNIEGLVWFNEFIWPGVKLKWPKLKLLIVGGGEGIAEYAALKSDPSILFTGRVADLSEWYNKATVAIVPLQSGSGTRLKILEAMNFGVPVIATAIGAEGLNVTNEVDILIRNEAEPFVEAIDILLLNRDKRQSFGQAARRLIEAQYDWDKIGNSFCNYLINGKAQLRHG